MSETLQPIRTEITQPEKVEVSRGVSELSALLNNTAWEQAILNEDVQNAVPSMRQELIHILADDERKVQLEQALAVWGDCKGNRTGRGFYENLRDDELVHGGVYHWFTNAAVKGKNRFTYSTIQDFIDFSLEAEKVLAGQADEHAIILHRKPGKTGKVLARQGNWVFIARQDNNEEARLITAIPGYTKKRFARLVQKEQTK